MVLTTEGARDTWVCPVGHGLAMTLTEAPVRLQDDEVAALWQLARTAVAGLGRRGCPICSVVMVSVEVPFDDDEFPEGVESDAPDPGAVWLDVCEPCQFIWFDASELGLFPGDRPDVAVSEAELAEVAAIRAEFGQRIAGAAEVREATQLTEQIYRQIARRPGLHRILSEVGSLGRA